MNPKWSDEEIAIVEEMACLNTVKQIAYRLKRRGYIRSTSAIQYKLRFLGYSARPILDNYNCCEIARVLQLNSATVWSNEILHATQNQIIATGELEVITVQKPAFVLGERVILCSHDKGTKQRLILGIALVHNSWFYIIELMSPTLTPPLTISNRFSLVGEKSLVRVNA